MEIKWIQVPEEGEVSECLGSVFQSFNLSAWELLEGLTGITEELYSDRVWYVAGPTEEQGGQISSVHLNHVCVKTEGLL